MNIQNKKSVILFPLILSLVLVAGIIIGVKLSNSGVGDRLLIYPRTDKVSSILNLIEDSYVDTISRKKLEETAINSILQNLDPHSAYIPAEDLQAINEPLEGNFSGIGVVFNNLNDTIVVVSTVTNGPSAKAGVKAGDRLVRVNDSIVAGKKLRTDAVIKRLKGKRGTFVNISVKRLGAKGLLNFKIQRDMIPIHSIDASYMAAPSVGYVKINKFAKNTRDEFVSAVKKLHKQGMKKIIIDLRGNGGGLLETAIDIADEFLDNHKLIVYTQGRSRPRTDAYSTPGGECLKDSVVVLIDEYTASASEILAGAIQDNDRGWIIGRRSFGKGLVQEQTPLPGGAAFRLTIARYYTPSGRCIQKPYVAGKEDYFDELHKRVAHGELEEADSIKFNRRLHYKTRRGREVYGGGGIMPDFFIPADTLGYTRYYYFLHEKGLINQFAFQYSDNNRLVLNKCKNYKDIQNIVRKDNILDRLVRYAEARGVKKNARELKISSQILQTLLEAYIVRNFFDDAGFYPVLNTADNTLREAVTICQKGTVAYSHYQKKNGQNKSNQSPLLD